MQSVFTQKLFLFFIFCFLFSLPALAQKNVRRGSPHASNVFLELVGNTGILSLNYDRRFSEGSNGLGGRIGIGLGEGRAGHTFPEIAVTVPVVINYLLGSGPHYLETGVGLTIGSTEFGEKLKSSYFVPNLGYRFQKLAGGFTMRIVASPFLGGGSRYPVAVSFGVGF